MFCCFFCIQNVTHFKVSFTSPGNPPKRKNYKKKFKNCGKIETKPKQKKWNDFSGSKTKKYNNTNNNKRNPRFLSSLYFVVVVI
jgi:hypothetical protein